jgi:ribonuclease P protein component
LIPTVARGEDFSFPRRYRLTRTDEFSSVFGFRRAIRGSFFLLHYGPARRDDGSARLGLVIGKKLLRHAVGRNGVKRIARERFRLRRAGLPACDLVLRLAVRLTKPDRRAVAADIETLLARLTQRLADRRAVLPDAQPASPA